MTNEGKGAIATVVKPQETKAVVQWKGEPITITFQDVKGLICPLATDQEVAIFLKTCQSLQLNPFANEIYLIKYARDGKAATVIAIESYLKAAEPNDEYNGHEAGIILKDTSGQLEYRNGAFLLDEERAKLVGGWAKVYRKDRERPIYIAVSKAEAVKFTRAGVPTEFWAEEKQPWMLRKTALKRGLVEAFPSLYEGTLSTAEIGPEIEGKLPRAFENNGDNPDWPKFWVRVQNELGLTEVQAHALLGVESVKQLIEQGQTLEQIWLALVDKVKERDTSEKWPQPMDEEFEPMFDDAKVEAPIDWVWLNHALKTLKTGGWDYADYVRKTFPKAKGKTFSGAIDSLPPEQKAEFCKEVQKRLEAKGK